MIRKKTIQFANVNMFSVTQQSLTAAQMEVEMVVLMSVKAVFSALGFVYITSEMRSLEK